MSDCPNPAPRPNGRYRFSGGKPVDPSEEARGIPNSPEELLAMQEGARQRPEKPERQRSAKVKQVLELIESLTTSALEDQQIALALVAHLENHHDTVVKELQDDEDAAHGQIVAWAIDADRLMRCRVLLDSVDLE